MSYIHQFLRFYAEKATLELPPSGWKISMSGFPALLVICCVCVEPTLRKKGASPAQLWKIRVGFTCGEYEFTHLIY